MENIYERAKKVKLLLMDVDGVLTNSVIYHIPDGEGGWTETKGFDSQDGIALQWCNAKGIRTGVISGRISQATDERAKQFREHRPRGGTEGHQVKVLLTIPAHAFGELKGES